MNLPTEGSLQRFERDLMILRAYFNEGNMCEDYPCCGHEPGDCPERFTCTECGKRLSKKAMASICNACLRRMMYSDHFGRAEYIMRWGR